MPNIIAIGGVGVVSLRISNGLTCGEWISPAAHGLGLDCGSGLEKQFGGGGISRLSTLVKGWIEFRNWCTLVQLSRFAYTTYAKTLIELRTWARGGDDGDPAAFLVKMQTLDNMVTDFVPPLTETYRMVYEAQYIYRPINVTDPFPEPTIPVCLPPDDVDAAPNDAKADDNNKAVSYPSLYSWSRLSLRPVKPLP